MSRTTIRSTAALALAAACVLPAAAGAQSAAPSSPETRAEQAAERTAQKLKPAQRGLRVMVLSTTSRCRKAGGSRRFTCRITHTVADGSGGVAVGSRRRCTVRNAVVVVGARRARVARLPRFRCTSLDRQPAPAAPAPGPAPSTPSTPDAPTAPEMPSAPPAGPGGAAPGTPPGAAPDGPPPPVASASGERSFKNARPGGTWAGWSGWYQIEGGWWINNAWWDLGSSAPAGAHMMGWQNEWYFESYYWGYDRYGRLGMQFWYSGRTTT